MATQEITYLHGQLENRRRRLEEAMALAPQDRGLAGLLREVDSALERMDKGTYGRCLECGDAVEADRLQADPLVCYCLDHLTQSQRAALQRDLELASEVQRKLLPPLGLSAGQWETSYHYAPLGAVSGDYCDLIPTDGHLFFAVGDVSGKGVAASMLMTQLHALFRSLTGVTVPLGRIVTLVNRFFCDTALVGQYATLVCGQAKPDGEVEIHNAGHCPAIVVTRDGVQLVESTGLPLGLFHEAEFSSTTVKLEPGDTLFLYSDGLSEAHCADDEYGVERIAKLVREKAAHAPGDLIAATLEDVRKFAESGASDDLTVMAIRRKN